MSEFQDPTYDMDIGTLNYSAHRRAGNMIPRPTGSQRSPLTRTSIGFARDEGINSGGELLSTHLEIFKVPESRLRATTCIEESEISQPTDMLAT